MDNEKKYELVNDDFVYFKNKKLYRIKALISFNDVNAGDIGGFVESEYNLSHSGNCWIYDMGTVSDNAKVIGAARVCENAKVCDDAIIGCYAEVHDNAMVGGCTHICDNALVYGDTVICPSFAVIGYGANIQTDDDYLTVKGLGAYNHNITFFRTHLAGRMGINVYWRGFSYALDQFAKEIKKRFGDSKYTKEYQAMIEVAKIHFGIGD